MTMIQNIGNVNLLTNGFSHYHNNEFKKNRDCIHTKQFLTNTIFLRKQLHVLDTNDLGDFLRFYTFP